MAKTVSADKVEIVISDWERVKKVDDYESVAGRLLFQNLFEKCPEAKPLFGFPMTMDPKNPALLKSPRFAKHADFLVGMVDKTVGMLGSGLNQELELTDMLHELGRKHVAYGVKPEFFCFMTESLLAMLVEVIGNPDDLAWQDVFDFLIANMEAGHRRINKDVSAKKDKIKCITVWSKLRTMKKYKEEGGVILFQHLFEACPQIKVLFGFPIDVDPRSDELLKSKRFSFHASFLMEMVEKTVQMLGDDNETLTNNLTELGQKHVSFGVTPQYFPYMTDALVVMLKEMLGSDFTDDDKQAFENVMAVLIADMVRGQRSIDKGLAAAKKFLVVESWLKLTKLPNYHEKGGILLFQNVFDKCPESKLLFGFPETIDPFSDKLLQNKRFLSHSQFLLNMIGKTVAMLGENNEELTNDLVELGKKHVTYGVKSEYFPFMTRSIIIMMKEMLGAEFTPTDQQAWEDIMSVLIADMVKGQRTLDIGLAAANKNITNKNWSQISEIEDYDEVCGLLVFEKLFAQCPEALPLFGFSPSTKVDEIKDSKRLLVHASFIIEMIEKALSMLGRDDKELEKFMEDLGRRHILYEVKPEYMVFMQSSILHMLKTQLEENKTPLSSEDEAAWHSVLSSLVANMTRVQREIEMKKLAQTMSV
ncbi:globin-like protein [Nitzschia inconspicua]|uniref:Globin-like protein n=1 Tax=Nitzschia inconspicua TaxID=303405 RepID=A0A9K3KMV6_9STRA|nr:globin-like protein [Nitzschia inconspicua]